MAMDKFPPELLVQVLSCLDVNDLLNCRLVNRQWKATIECHIRIHGLTVREQEVNPKVFLVFTTPSMNSNHRFVSCRSGDFTKISFLKIILKNLKKLSVNKFHSEVIGSLNKLANLENLFIRGIDTKLTIQSTSLRTLAVKWKAEKAKLSLDTPNLSKIDFYSKVQYRDSLRFVGSGDPKSITHLSALEFSEVFPQLANLKVCYLVDSERIPSGLLKIFPALQLLHFARCESTKVSALLSSKSKLRRTEFKLYHLGLPIDRPKLDGDMDVHFDIGYLAKYVDRFRYKLNIVLRKEWASSSLSERKHFRLLLSNYSRLPSQMPYNVFVNYRSLNRHFNGQIDRGFFSRFINIRFLNVEKPIGDQDQFLWFLRNCKQLEKLVIKNALDQKLYDQLPEYWPSSSELAIEEAQKLDWKFLLEFKQLLRFTTGQEISLSLVTRAIQKFETLKYFEFQRHNRLVRIPFDQIDYRFPDRKSLVKKQLIQCLKLKSNEGETYSMYSSDSGV